MAETAAAGKKRVVRYKHSHTFSVRLIEAKDWKNVGADGQKTVRWDASNNWEVPADQFSEAALEYVKRDEDLTIVEV